MFKLFDILNDFTVIMTGVNGVLIVVSFRDIHRTRAKQVAYSSLGNRSRPGDAENAGMENGGP